MDAELLVFNLYLSVFIRLTKIKPSDGSGH